MSARTALLRVPVAAAAAALLVAGCGSDEDSPTAVTIPPTTAAAVTTASTTATTIVAAPNTAAPAPGAVTAAQAGNIALNAVGGGQVIKVEADDEDNRRTWKVELQTTAGEKRKVSVDQATGQVLKNEAGD
jgi:uncharacterized membrane protein YkoI